MKAEKDVIVDREQVRQVLTRSVEHVYPSVEAFESALLSGKRLTIFYGIDPTAPTLHIGHTIMLRKLRELQHLGHHIILLIGDFTAMIGDPTDKLATRKVLTREEVQENCRNYKKLIAGLLDFDGPNAAEMKYNSEWLAKMSFADVIDLAAHFTVQQMIERDMFEKRIAEGKPVYLHEFFYPLMQGYDSVAMDVDAELGGNDQTFNMLAGRTLQKEMNNKEKFIITGKLLVDPTGKKMGKSEGNMVTLEDAAEDIYGKIMSWTDGMILPGYELLTDISMNEIQDMRSQMADGENPVAFKRRLAREVVQMLRGAEAANEAEEQFQRVHQQHEAPEEIPEFRLEGPSILADVLVSTKLVASKGEARRQIEQRGIKVDGEVASDPMQKVSSGSVIQKGKRFFVRVILNEA